MFDSVSMVSSGSTVHVAGYTIVRVLARSRRATLVLARHAGDPRALRIVAEEHDAAQLDREIDARARASPAHAAAMLDLATSDTGAPVVVLEHLSGPRLDELLDCRRGNLSAGEAVTLIVPLLEAVCAAHDRGLTYGGLTVEGVRLRSDGAPVITRFSAARAGAVLPEHLRGRGAEYRTDHDSARALAVVIARHVATPEVAPLLAVLDGDRAPDLDPGFRSTIAGLFECAEPTPVLIEAGVGLDPERGERGCGAREPGTLEPGGQQRGEARVRPEGRWLAPLLRRLALPDSLAQTVLEVERRLAARGTAVRTRSVRGVRPRMVVLGAAGALSVLLAMLLLNAGDPDVGTGATPGLTASTSQPSARPTPPGAMGPVQRDEPIDAPEDHLAPEPEEWVEVVGELVERWLSCREGETSTVCSHESAQQGSSAEAALHAPGEYLVLALRRWSEGDRELIVVERMGAAVFVDLVGPETTTASLLLMRSEAGWRLRDVLVEPPRG